MICTRAAVTGPPPAVLSRVGRTTTQSPAVTSDTWAAASDETFVEFVKSTVALPFCSATAMVLPATDEMSPAT